MDAARDSARIAIIDGSPEIAEVVSNVLEDGGYDPVIIQESEDAVERVSRDHPDLLILDPWLSSRMAGWKILALLLSDARTRQIPIIIYSGDTDRLLAHKCFLEEHDVAVLPKPFDIEDLERTVAEKLVG
jgi:CheY-like chemotaxis protein